jgi:hypothetical protein
MDGVGRGDTRWDYGENFLRDNFDNAPTNSNNSIKAYRYGLFSFTKSMLLHSPGGSLSPITCLRSGDNAAKPPIDWYAADADLGTPDTCQSPAAAPTSNGVARLLTDYQCLNGAAIVPGGGSCNASNSGDWTQNQNFNTGEQNYFQTPWSIIMLRRSVFVACVNNLNGAGTPGNSSLGTSPRIDLTWTTIANVDHYNVMRGTTNGGPYNLVGAASGSAFSDTTAGLVNGGTYYYVLQPINATGSEICQSNQATIKIPTTRGR